MKPIIKFNLEVGETSFLAGGNQLQSILQELQLEVDYIEHGENLINIHCAIPEGTEVLPDTLYSLFGSMAEEGTTPSMVFFSKRIRIKLSKDDIQRLMQSADWIQLSDDFEPIVSSEKNTSNTFDNDFLERIFELMDNNMSDETYWVDNLSSDMNVSRSTLFRKLKNLTGQAPQSFMRKIRLERAVNLLETGQLRIAEVAYQVGFADPNYFSKCFRKFFGKSPSSFIAQGKKLYLPQIEL